MVTYNSLLQSTVPDRLRGRIFAFYDVVWQGSRLVSIAAGGVLADAFGIRAVYVFGKPLLFAAGVLGLYRLRGPDLAAAAGELATNALGVSGAILGVSVVEVVPADDC